MFEKIYFKSRRIVWVIVAAGITAASAMANAHPIFLGPANPGAESGSTKWIREAKGSGSMSIERDDPANGHSYFSIGIASSSSEPTNQADFRSDKFSLGQATEAQRPITLSFAYKLPDKVKSGDNIALYFRFFDAKKKFLDQTMILIGSSTDDSEMTPYKTMTVTNILAPDKAVTADIWVTANAFEPWTSGTAQFDDFSVTINSVVPWVRIFVIIFIFIVPTALLFWTLYLRRRRIGRARIGQSDSC